MVEDALENLADMANEGLLIWGEDEYIVQIDEQEHIEHVPEHIIH